jgi:hypothetical protein
LVIATCGAAAVSFFHSPMNYGSDRFRQIFINYRTSMRSSAALIIISSDNSSLGHDELNGPWLALQDTGPTGDTTLGITVFNHARAVIGRPKAYGTDFVTLPGTTATLRVKFDG